MGSVSSKESRYDSQSDRKSVVDSRTDQSNLDDIIKRTKSNPVCLNCSKETQTDLPANDVRTAIICFDQYQKVQTCMEANQGQISACSSEWKEFQDCHDASKTR